MTDTNRDPIEVLLVEDNPGDARLVCEVLGEVRHAAFSVRIADRLGAALAELERKQYDAVLLDLSLPDSLNIETFDAVNMQCSRLPIIVLTGFEDEVAAVDAVRRGAQDYILKGDLDGALLARAVVYAIERKRAEERIRCLNRLYSVLSKVNTAIVRIRDTAELYREACRIVAEYGLIRTAWIGMVDQERWAVPVAHWHRGADHCVCDAQPAMDGPEGRTPMDMVLRQGHCRVTNDLGVDQTIHPWRAQGEADGCRSVASFPFRAGDGLAVLCLYADETGFFFPELVELLVSLAEDLSHAVDSIEHEKMRVAAEAALRASERRFRDALANLRGLLAVQLDAAGTVTFCNDSLCTSTGWGLSEILGRDWFDVFVPAEERDGLRSLLLASTHQDMSGVTSHEGNHVVTRSGDRRLIEWNHTPLLDSDGAVIGVSCIGADVTRQRQSEKDMVLHNLELGLLNSVPARLSGSQDPSEVAQRLRELTESDWGVEAGRVLLCGPAADAAELMLAWGWLADDPTATANMPEPPAMGCHPGPSVSVHRYTGCVSRSEVEADTIRTPLVSEGAMLGILELCAGSPGMPGAERLQFYEILGQQIGAALHASQLYEELRRNNERLHHLSAQLVTAQEDERRRVAMDLHDGIGALVTALSLNLARREDLSREQLSHRSSQMQSIVSELTSQVREMSLQLRPSMLDDFGLLPALRWHFRRYTEQTSVQVEFSYSCVDSRFDPQVEISAFRIAQEALTNVARHANVSEVRVSLSAEDGTMILDVEDRGTGFDIQNALSWPGNCGLTGMQERALLAGGELLLDSTPGVRTLVRLVIPLSVSTAVQY